MLYVDIVFIIVLGLYLLFVIGMIRALSLDAPYVPIKSDVLKRMLDMVSPAANTIWIDLGSGDGRVLIEAVKKFNVRGIGIERIFIFRLYSRLKIFIAGLSKKIKIKSGDLFEKDLSSADIVSFYLLPKTNEKIVEKLKKELKPETRILYHRFPVPGIHVEKEDVERKIFVSVVGNVTSFDS